MTEQEHRYWDDCDICGREDELLICPGCGRYSRYLLYDAWIMGRERPPKNLLKERGPKGGKEGE